MSGTGAVTGSGALLGASGLVLDQAGTLAGSSGELAGASALSFAVDGALEALGAGQIFGTADLVFTATLEHEEPPVEGGVPGVGSGGRVGGWIKRRPILVEVIPTEDEWQELEEQILDEERAAVAKHVIRLGKAERRALNEFVLRLEAVARSDVPAPIMSVVRARADRLAEKMLELRISENRKVRAIAHKLLVQEKAREEEDEEMIWLM